MPIIRRLPRFQRNLQAPATADAVKIARAVEFVI